MTREELARTLAEIQQAREGRIEIWRQIVEADGTLAELIHTGTYHPRAAQTRRVPGVDL